MGWIRPVRDCTHPRQPMRLLRSVCRKPVFTRADIGQGFPCGVSDRAFPHRLPGVEPAAQRTCNNFKQHIILAQQDNCNKQRTSNETGYGLAAQAEKMELMTENFANYVTTERSSQALVLAAALEDKIASEATNRIALQNITNQYLQLAKKFDDAMAKMKAPMPTTNLLRATTPRDRKPSVGPW
jgi:hypothetical protein